MAYYNPFQQQMPQNHNPFAAFQPQQQTPRIDPNQFRQIAMTLNDNHLQQLIQLARQRGISDADIQAGINFLRLL